MPETPVTTAAPAVVPEPATVETRSGRRVDYIRSHAALRGIAALLVVAYHLQFGVPYRLAIETATPFFERGYLFVDLFFILSGFVISLTSDSGRPRPFSPAEAREFYAARLARIYPLHLFCLVAIVVAILVVAALRRGVGTAAVAIAGPAAGSLVAELLLVQAWIPGTPHWNVPSWSISAELFAYLVFPLLLLIRSRVPRLAATAAFAVPLGYYGAVMAGSGSLDVTAGSAPLRCLAGFLIGTILYDRRRLATRWSGGAIALGQAVATAGIVFALATRCPDPLIVPFFALLVFATWQDRGPAAALLVRRPFERAGQWSYSIYLVHVGLIGLALPIVYAPALRIVLDPDMARLMFIVGCFAATLLVSRWTFAHVERPGRRWARRLLRAALW